MWYEELFSTMEAAGDPEQAKKMEAYMQHRFAFLGIKKPALDAATAPFLKAVRRAEPDWDFVFRCWDKPYREAQYVAVGYLRAHRGQLKKDDLARLRQLITTKSWWETVDCLDVVCADLLRRFPELAATMRQWSCDANLWLRRTAIDVQQSFKEETDKALLTDILENNLGSSEFFINKAIGWSLRTYSKTDPDWVRRFLDSHDDTLAALSKREASKYI